MAAALFVLLLAASAQAQGLRLGFADGAFGADPATRAAALEHTAAVGGTIVRFDAAWSGIAPTRPAHPADPSDPAYRWASLDAAVQDAVRFGRAPLLMIGYAPAWAEGKRRPSEAAPGSWRPNAAAFGQFSRAIAMRYSGTFAGLPRVRYWEIWNEPNLPDYLSPQYEFRHRRLVPASPGIFRSLVNAASAGLKSVHRDNFVVSGGTAPYGDTTATPEGRTPPVSFLRGVLAKRTNLDAISHHPYGVGSPYQRATASVDVAVADVSKLVRVLRAAERAGHVRHGRKVWVTEISWDSRPPDPDGVPERRQADWLQRSLEVLWRQGVSTVTWYLVGDQAPVPSYGATNQGGVFFRDGRRKLSATAFEMPFVARPASARSAVVWGRSPARGRVIVERLDGGSWHRVWSHVRGAGAVYSARVAARPGDRLRARVVGGPTSLVWRLR